MGIFVRVQGDVSQRQEGLVLVYELRQSTFTNGLVSDYVLLDHVTGEEVSQIHCYPRCTETGLTLFMRMLDLAPAHALAGPAAGRISVSLRIGNEPVRALERELLVFTVDDSSLLVDLLSPAGVVESKRVPIDPTPTVREAICEAMRSALGWGTRQLAPPAPLSDIPIRRTASGQEYVCLADVPPLPRQYLRLHMCRSVKGQKIEASLWRAYLWRCAGSLEGERA